MRYICRMKWFEITTEEEAQALKHYRMSQAEMPKVGDKVSPSAVCFTVTAWPEYPEADRLTFEECMAIVRDEVTVEVMKELGGGFAWQTVVEVRGQKWTGIYIGDSCRLARGDEDGAFELDAHVMRIPNMTATKLRILVAILKGEKI